MTEDFNIRDSSWDPNFSHHSIHRDTLIDISDSFNLELSKPTNHILTRYSNNQHNSNLVIDIMFLRPELSELDSHSIYLDWRSTSDHASLAVNITIFEEHIQTKKHTIVKKSKEEDNFISKLIETIKRLNIENVQNKEALEHIMQTFAKHTKRIWYKHSKIVNITKYFEAWWDNDCHRDLEKYKQTKRINDWK